MRRMDPGHVKFYEGYGTVEQTEPAQVRAVYTDTPSTYLCSGNDWLQRGAGGWRVGGLIASAGIINLFIFCWKL